MSLIPQLTPLEAALAAKTESIARVGEALHHLATVMKNENSRFWQQPDELLLGVLNHDVAGTLATFEANTRLGVAVNAMLDELEPDPVLRRFPTRASVVPGRGDVVYDGTAFVVTAPEQATASN